MLGSVRRYMGAGTLRLAWYALPRKTSIPACLGGISRAEKRHRCTKRLRRTRKGSMKRMRLTLGIIWRTGCIRRTRSHGFRYLVTSDGGKVCRSGGPPETLSVYRRDSYLQLEWTYFFSR